MGYKQVEYQYILQSFISAQNLDSYSTVCVTLAWYLRVIVFECLESLEEFILSLHVIDIIITSVRDIDVIPLNLCDITPGSLRVYIILETWEEYISLRKI